MQQLRDLHVLILGLGASGLAMARWCARHGAVVTVADTREAPPQLAALQAEWPAVKFVTGAFSAALVEGTPVRAVFRSPGLSPQAVAPVVEAARAAGLWQGGELSLFAAALQDLKARFAYAPKVLGITGTNGKTTVTSLTGQLVARAGKTVRVAGNIGPTLLDTLAQAIAQAEVDAPVLEQQELQVRQAELERLEAEEAPKAPAADVEPTEEVADDDVQAQDQPMDEGDEVDVSLLVMQAPEALPAMARVLPEVWVLELSSFQLDSSEGFEPTAATVLNLTQDHLDWHGTMQAYADAKARIFGQQGVMVLNRQDAVVMAMLPPPVRVKLQRPVERAHVTFGLDMPQRPGDWGLEVVNGMAWLVRAQEADETRKRRKNEQEELFIQRLMPADALRIRGRHNASNALAALALASAAGCALAPMLYGLREYEGEPHRVQSVAVVNDIEYVDDSKGTNVGATVAALEGLGADRRLVVILGGEGKGQDFTPLVAPVQRCARAVVLIGKDASLIEQALQEVSLPKVHAKTLQEAVHQSHELAQAGDAVLLSPACASLDMFENYAHRAQVFCEEVQELALASGNSMEGAL
ncbi:MAG: UDP-N-acetylmuramoylalanine--D-glutamate ligase [Pseudomonadota bacterium]|jgi:UDP-N-acetylmuramoylalanine--D-glutamate ligase